MSNPSSSSTPSNAATLLTAAPYVHALEHLSRARSRHDDEGEILGALLRDAPRLARSLAVDVAAGRYAFGPLESFTAFATGKLRTLHRAEVLDRIVLTALTKTLVDEVESALSERLYSYRPGFSNVRALRAFSLFLREHRQARPDPKTRGLYVIRTDIANYGESIRTDDDSPLWSALEPICARWPAAVTALLRDAIRQPVAEGDAPPSVLERGVPTGSPVQPALCNLYLSAADHELASLPGVFSARFGDDILLASDAPAKVEGAFDVLARHARERSLILRPEKTQRLFSNGAGRASTNHDAADFLGTSHVDYLGARVGFSGDLALRPDKENALVRRIEARLATHRELPTTLSLDERGRFLCEIVRRAFDPRDPLQDPLAGLFAQLVSDRAARRRVIRRVELSLVRQLTRLSGHRAFRDVPPRQLRAWGFPRLDQPAFSLPRLRVSPP